MKNLLLGGAALAMIAVPAYAGTLTINTTEVVTETKTGGGEPTVTYNLPASFTVTNGGSGVLENAFTLSPGGSCTGTGCIPNSNGTGNSEEQDTIAFSGTISVVGGGAIIFSEMATYTAAYSGNILGCASGDGVSPGTGETDCLIWQGAPNTFNGSVTDNYLGPGGLDVAITYHNATDWNLEPQITIAVSEASSAPEPSTWALMGIGFGLMAIVGLRKRRGVQRFAV